MTGADLGREQSIIKAFVGLSHELVEDYDVVEMLTTLTSSCVDLIDIESAGLLLADSQDVLHLAASSSEDLLHLELFQLQRDEGPCLDAFREGRQVIVTDADEIASRWPQFAAAAARGGFTSIHALPMLLRDQKLGTLGLFGTSTGRLGDDDLALAQALVHVASVAIVNEHHATDKDTVKAQLQRALLSRVTLEQAKGFIAASGSLTMADAFVALRQYSRDRHIRLSQLATLVVDRELNHQVILDHARTRNLLPASSSPTETTIPGPRRRS